MADFYYLMSSLPMLKPAETPPIRRNELLNICQDKLPKTQFELLRQLSLVPAPIAVESCSAVKRWYEWETCLRNRLARQRSSSDNPADDYIQAETNFFSEIEPAIQEAIALDNPLDRERRLDALRWRCLDDIAACDDFSFNALAVYMIKLLLLEKWLPRDNDTGYQNLDMAVAGINAAPAEEN